MLVLLRSTRCSSFVRMPSRIRTRQETDRILRRDLTNVEWLSRRNHTYRGQGDVVAAADVAIDSIAWECSSSSCSTVAIPCSLTIGPLALDHRDRGFGLVFALLLVMMMVMVSGRNDGSVLQRRELVLSRADGLESSGDRWFLFASPEIVAIAIAITFNDMAIAIAIAVAIVAFGDR